MAKQTTPSPAYPWDETLVSGVQTFMGVPYSRDLSKSKAAILGIPFDCGLHPVRQGARMGPAALREQSTLVRPYQPPIADWNPLVELGVVDCGNVRVALGDTVESFRRIEAAVSHIVDAGCVPITFGGDGSVSLPQIRAVHRKYPDLCLVHFDAHTDTYPDVAGQQVPGTNIVEFNPSTTFTRAAEEGILDVKNSLHIGPRGTVSVQGVFDFTRKQGYELITGADLMERGLKSTLAHIHARIGDRPVYLCWDMDFFDPSCAPGVFTPTWGGVSAREGRTLLQGLSGLNSVATDVNTLSPLHDIGGMSAFLAGTCVIECVFLAAAAEKKYRGR